MATQEDTTIYDSPEYKRVINLQIQLEEIEGVAKLAEEACDDGPLIGTFSVIQHRLDAVRRGLDDLIPPRPASGTAGNGADEPKAGNGADKEPAFVVPQMLGRPNQDEWDCKAYSASHDYQKHLSKAEGRIAEAKGLTETLRCALRSDDYDPEPFADQIAGSIVDLLSKAQNQLDKHGIRDTNLFLAYFEKDRPEESKTIAAIMAGIENEPPEERRAFADILELIVRHDDKAMEWLREITSLVMSTGQRRRYSEVLEQMRARQQGGAA